MNTQAILPMLAMVLLVYINVFAGVYYRIKAVKAKTVRRSAFKTFSQESGGLTEHLTQLKNHFDNIFQMPVLFFAGMILAIAIDGVNSTIIVSGWGFVIARYAHSYIHTTYNNVLHRMLAFAACNVFCLVIWINIAVNSL